jgi:hypothetical protein
MFQRILDGTTSLAVLAVCILIFVQAVRSNSLPPSPVPDNSPASARLTPGDRIEPIAGVDLTASPKTLVMAIQSSCHFCSESMAFYRELAGKKSTRIRLVVVAPDDPVVARAYVAANGFSPDAIASADLTSMRVSGTPTLLLVNPSGVIERAWMGKLTTTGEKEVLAEVAK